MIQPDKTISIEKVVNELRLQPLLPEGGYYRQTFKSPMTIQIGQKQRSLMTNILYLITKNSFSAFHRLTSVEIYHYYAGSRIEVFTLGEKGLKKTILGTNISKNEVQQLIVEPNVWQASRLLNNDDSSWGLVGTTVSPGFEFEDFELAQRDQLIVTYPEHHLIISEMTRL